MTDLDRPVPTEQVGQLCGAGLGEGQVGDRIDDHGAPAAAVEVADAASDLQCLACVREAKASHGDDLEAAGLDPAMAAVATAVQHRDVMPGKLAKLGVQGGLVGLDREQVVDVLVGHQELGGVAFGCAARRR